MSGKGTLYFTMGPYFRSKILSGLKYEVIVPTTSDYGSVCHGLTYVRSFYFENK